MCLGVQVALNCRTVCTEWNSYLESSDIWQKLLRNETIKADNFASKLKTLLSEKDMGYTWTWLWKFNNFVFHQLEIGVFRSLEFFPKSEKSAIKHLTQRLELAQKMDLEADPLRAHEFMMHEEIRLEKIHKNHRDRAGLMCNPNGDKIHEAMLKISNVNGLSSETFYQVR